MNYKIVVSKQIQKFLITHPDAVDKFFACMELVSLNPFDAPCDIKKMQGIKNCYRLRIRDYRFLYQIDRDIITVTVYTAGNRGEI